MRIDVGAAIALAVVAVAWIVVDGPFGLNHADPESRTSPHAAWASTSASAASRTGDGGGAVPVPVPAPAPVPDAGILPVSAASAASAPAPASSAGIEVPAAWSLADARVAGDDRAPPFERAKEEAATPAWQLDNHQAYARREQDRHQAVQRAFVDAADREIPRLDQQIEQGRAMGVPPEQLAKGEEKRRRIAEMRARMQADLAASTPAP
ncbi:hypothetical protein [Mitsuaria sp. 7]|uniref:hypothetical protein n=1 Tax=Mitsuaria sp. 7 TaxID=1658665 RepID=UPI0007DD531E|nr:hypothetical protein [Mitsuaria sp. 7]ANH67604.1 hypothetical protein ABE85_08560 [Mitsuaria sp. 7]